MTATSLITGTVAGFALVIDPNNEKGKRERIEYLDAAQMKARVSQLNRENIAAYNADPRHYDPTETLYYTLYRRDDNGTMEDEVGFDTSGQTNIGMAAYKATCKCGDVAWFKRHSNYTPSGTYTCEDCNKPDGDCGDFTNYDGMQEREY